MSIRISRCLTKALLATMLLAIHAANADILVLKNGDRITGEVKRIWDAEITIEPAYSDEFLVDLPAVHHIESERDFEIEFDDGMKVLGQFAGVDDDGNQVVRVGDESVSFPLAAFFELDEPEDAFDWDSNVEFSAALNSGNTNTYNTKMKADTTVRFSDHRHIGEVTLFREQVGGLTTQEKDQIKYAYNWLFRDPLFFSANLSFERDPIIELGQRVILSAGIGRDIWNTPRRLLSLQIGLGGQTEELGSIRTDSTVATWILAYRQDFFSDKFELYHNNSITYNISGRTNTSYKTTTGVRFEITDLLYANLSADFNYETDPVDTAENEDVAILVGLGAEF
jgi:putative salt-induced outer membrane protein YdiY